MKKIAVLFLVFAMALSCACFGDPSPEMIEKRVASYAERIKPQVVEAMEAMKETLAVDVYAEGASLVMEYRFLSDVNVDTAAIERNLINSGETFKGSYDDLRKYAGSDTVSVVIRYLASDGSKLLDYVIDKDFVPGEGSGFKTRYSSVEELIASDEFLSSIATDPSTGIETTAYTEGKSVVIAARLLEEYDSDQLSAIAEEWLGNIAGQSGSAAKILKDYLNMVVGGIEGYDLLYRLLDVNGNTVAEHREKLD